MPPYPRIAATPTLSSKNATVRPRGRYDPATGAYEPLGSRPAVSGASFYAYADTTQPFGRISYYRVVGVLADGI
ncbi:hypothetical protein [Actinacidiphila glaucinigra]|uniref:hypothetical protein n=1 Tax=Actinacidiphila glaucinigra TaxID=235986 RepID=UPI003671C1D3